MSVPTQTSAPAGIECPHCHWKRPATTPERSPDAHALDCPVLIETAR